MDVRDEQAQRAGGLPRPRLGDTTEPAPPATRRPAPSAPVCAEAEPARRGPVVRLARWMRVVALSLIVCTGFAAGCGVVVVAVTEPAPNGPLLGYGLVATLTMMVTAGVLGCLGQVVEYLGGRGAVGRGPTGN